MTRYQLILLAVLLLWPLVIIAVLFLMARLERYVTRMEGRSPREAGLEPVAGKEREVRIVVGDEVVGEPESAK